MLTILLFSDQNLNPQQNRSHLIRIEPVYAPGDRVRGHRVTQVRVRRLPADRTSLICQWSGGGRSDKGQGFECDKRGPALAPGSHHGQQLQEGIQRPTEHHQESLGDVVFAPRYASEPVRHLYRTPVGIYMRKLWCSEGQREGADRDSGSGRVQGIFFFLVKSLTLQESQIASGSRYPPLLLPFLPPCLPLSFLPFSLASLVFLFSFGYFSSFIALLFRLLWWSVRLGGVAQGDNVCREAVFEQDTSVSLAVQLFYEAVPVDHKAWTKPVVQKPRNTVILLLAHPCYYEFSSSYELDILKFISVKCLWLLTLDLEWITRRRRRNKQVKRQIERMAVRLIYE